MSLNKKFLLWFAAIGAYVMLLGGVFYYHLFRWTFEEKLKQEVLDTVRVRAPEILNGLLTSPAAISFTEYDILTSLNGDKRIVSLVYVGRQGKVRWHKEARFIGAPLDTLTAQVPFPTNVIALAAQSRQAQATPVPGQPLYELAIPFTLRGELIGFMDLLVSREGAQRLISSAMRKYVIGAVCVLVLLGLPLFFMLAHYVVAPIEALGERVGLLSARNTSLNLPPRSDEIGMLEREISALAGRMRAELEENTRRAAEQRDAEREWWTSLLGLTVGGGSYALVVDQDNTVLYSSFDSGRASSASGPAHLLDLVDDRQQDLLRLIAASFESPGRVLESRTVFKGMDLAVKVLHTGRTPESSRTIILFSQRAA